MRISLFVAAAACAVTATAAQAQSRIAAAFTSADINHDGKITRGEFVAARGARFDRLDRNGDGVVSRDDFARLISFRPKASPMIDAMIAEADSNHDGVVTRAEMMRAPPTQFDLADTNHDHVVDRTELVAFVDKLKAQI